MIHFAYPNVIPRESRYLGCGRYIAAPLDEKPGAEYELVELNVPNIQEIHLAALQLAPESTDSKQVIYERKDVSTQKYRGESCDLAYLLALISRSREINLPLSLPGKKTHPSPLPGGDIWCTGCIDIKGEDQPFLKAVDGRGFSCKLKTFLSEENPDQLFVVPAQNVLPTHEVLFQKKEVNVVSLRQFRRLSTQKLHERKTIVKVHGNELALLVETFFKKPTIAPRAEISVETNPYRGLFAFREEDTDLFFGREIYIAHLFEALQNQPLTTVIGASGSGKSSVVFAGLFPCLRRQNLMSQEKERTWLIVSCRPGANPFHALSSALLPILEPEKNEVDRLVESRQMAENIKSGQLCLNEVIKAIHKKNPDSRLLVFVDQFEEVYTLCSEEDVRRHFIDELLIACSQARSVPDYKLLLAMRADFLGKAFSYRPLADALQNTSLILGPMNREELREIIEKPAQLCGMNIEDGLTDRILDAVRDDPGSLPLLEFALTKLWEKQQYQTLNHAAYDEIGGVERALASYAESVYKSLSWEEKQQMQQIFTQLIRPGEGTEDTRRIAAYADIGEKNWTLVAKLADARLVVTGRSKDVPESADFMPGSAVGLSDIGQSRQDSHDPRETVELVHEALIKGWRRLREWMETDREFRIWQERLRIAGQQWKISGYDSEALLRGVTLAEARSWLTKQPNRINSEGKQFIELSVHARKKAQWRNRIGIMTVFTFIVIVAFFSLILWRHAVQQRRIADKNAIEALNQSAQALFLSKKDDLGALLAGLKAGKHAKRRDVPVTLRNRITFNLQEIVHGVHENNRLERHEGSVCALDFSPDGMLLASASNDKTVKLWDMADGREIVTLQAHPDTVKSIAFSPDGKILASGSSDQKIKLWNIADGKEILTLEGHSGPVRSLDFSPDGTILASGSDDHTIKLWKVEDGQELATLGISRTLVSPESQTESAFLLRFWENIHFDTPLPGHSGSVQSIRFSPDGTMLASGSNDHTIKLWQVSNGSEIRTLSGHTDAVRCVAFNPDGTMLASGSNDHTIKLWNVTDGNEVVTLSGHSDTVRSISFSPDGTRLVSGSDESDSTMKLWDIENFREIQTFRGHYNSVRSVRFHPDGMLIASGSDDYTIKLWHVTPRSKSRILQGHSRFVKSVDFSPDGTMIASGSFDHTIKLWNTATGREIRTFRGHSQPVWSIDFSPNGKFLASGGHDETVKLWDVSTGRELMTFYGHSGIVRSVHFSPKSQIFASGSQDKTIKLWNITNRSEIATLQGHTEAVQSVRFSPDGNMLVSGSDDHIIKLWDIAERREVRTFSGHVLPIFSVVFSPDGKLLASGSWDNTIRLWNVANGKEIRKLRGHSRTLLSVAFSPDGTLLASGSQDKTVKLWNVPDGREIATLQGHTAQVLSVTFSPDGTLLASGSDDHTTKLWNVDLNDALVHGCEWLYGYLKTNPNVRQADRTLCNDILQKKK